MGPGFFSSTGVNSVCCKDLWPDVYYHNAQDYIFLGSFGVKGDGVPDTTRLSLKACCGLRDVGAPTHSTPLLHTLEGREMIFLQYDKWAF